MPEKEEHSAEIAAFAAAMHRVDCPPTGINGAAWTEAHLRVHRRKAALYLDALHAAGRELVSAGTRGSLLTADVLAAS